MSTTTIAMPKLGMTMEEGTVIEWPLPLGSRVEKGEIVLIIESEKNEAEIEATGSGTLRHIYVEPGDVVPCKTLLAVLTESEDDAFDAEAFAADYASKVTPEPIKVETVVAPAPALAAAQTEAVSERRAVAPAARALAKKLSLDVENIPGTGPKGRVVKQDVEAFAEARERLAEVEPGIALEVLRDGEGDTLVFLPGFGSDVSSFAPQTSALTSGYEVVAINPRGIGASDSPELELYSVERAADDAAALIERPAHIVGASLGAATAIELALRHPEKVRSLALVTPLVERSARLRMVAEAWAALAAEASGETLSRFLMPWLFSDEFLEDDTARERTRRGLAQTVGKIPAATLDRTRLGLDAWSGTRADDLGQIGVPVLALIAGGDLLTPGGENVAADLPNAHTVVIAGAGHALAIEAAETVTRSLREHLASVR